MITLDLISDLHGYKPKTPGGDILIIAGDWTANDTEKQCFEFFDWVASQDYKHKILVAGNHDNRAEKETYRGPVGNQFIYLCDSGCEIEGIRFFGSPWTKKFYGQNPHAMAFGLDTDTQMMEKWEKIPPETNFLITHSPPFGILDKASNHRRVGCKELLKAASNIKPTVHCFGHLHANFGAIDKGDTIFINASHVNEEYEPINKPMRVIWENGNAMWETGDAAVPN